MIGPPPRLSSHDLGLFFDARHQALAAELDAVAGALFEDQDRFEKGLSAAKNATDAARDFAARIGRELGARHRLYRWLIPDPGGAVDVRALCLVREMLGWVSPLADAIFAVQGLGAHPVVLAGSTKQRALLDRVRSGDAICAFALTEPEAGSDVAAIATRARRDGDGFVLDGDKTFISNVGIATHYLVFATLDPDARKQGLAAFLVEAGCPGLTTEAIAMSIPHPIGAVRLAGCRVPSSALVGAPGEGFALAMRTLDTFRVTVGAAAVGMARRALDETLARVKARRQFGRALAEFQTVQGYLAEMATELDAARLLVLRAAHKKDTAPVEERAAGEAAMAKLFATEAAQRIIDRAVQLHGGLGVVSGSVVERLYREVRPLRIYEGTSEIQRIIIAKELLANARPL